MRNAYGFSSCRIARQCRRLGVRKRALWRLVARHIFLRLGTLIFWTIGATGLRWTLISRRDRIEVALENFLADASSCDIYMSLRSVIRATIMNTMTFTIESVHGVKQTLVLGPVTKPSSSEVPKEQASELERNGGSRAQSGTHSTH